MLAASVEGRGADEAWLALLLSVVEEGELEEELEDAEELEEAAEVGDGRARFFASVACCAAAASCSCSCSCCYSGFAQLGHV